MEEKLTECQDSKDGFAEDRAEKRKLFDKVLAVEVTSTMARSIPKGEGFINNVCRILKKNGVIGEYKNNDTGWDIAYSEKCVRNALKHFEGDRGVALTEHVPDLIKSGVYLETTQKNTAGPVSHIFATKAKFDGKESAIGFVVRESARGKYYYVHDIMTNNDLKTSGVTVTWQKTTGGAPPETAGSNPQSIRNILKKHLEIKKKDKNLFGPTGDDGLSDTHKRSEKEEADKVVAEYEAATDSDLVQFVKNVQEGRYEHPSAESYSIGQASLRAGQDVFDLTGIDITGYRHNIKGNAIEHIENRHGANGAQDRSMANADDYGRIGYVLEHYDDVDILRRKDGSGKTNKQFLDSAGNPSPMVRYEKRINGTFYVVEAVPDTKSRTLHIVSAYKSKAEKSGRQTPDVVQTPRIKTS